MTAENIEQLAARLKDLSNTIAAEEPSSLTASSAKRVRGNITQAYEKLRKVIQDLDPIKHPGFVFDPSNPEIAGRIAGIALLVQPRRPLANVKLQRFYGSGVYALYYKGEYSAYEAISGKEHPIYVGRADPAEASSKTAMEQGDRLVRRLSDHRGNIARAADTLRLEDFDYRALVVQTGWQRSAEEYLINLFRPIWNLEMKICYGFGKHGDDPATRANLRSPWDTLHPGRGWAHRDPRMKDARPAPRIIEDIANHFRQSPPLRSTQQILLRFLDEMRDAS